MGLAVIDAVLVGVSEGGGTVFVSVNVGGAVLVSVGGTKAVGEIVGVRLGLGVVEGVTVAVFVPVVVAAVVAVRVAVLVGVLVLGSCSGANASAIAPRQ